MSTRLLIFCKLSASNFNKISTFNALHLNFDDLLGKKNYANKKKRLTKKYSFKFAYNINIGFTCRNMAYDSSMGICLSALYSSCPEAVVKSTAADLVNVFLQSLWRTKSKELKVNIKTCISLEQLS